MDIPTLTQNEKGHFVLNGIELKLVDKCELAFGGENPKGVATCTMTLLVRANLRLPSQEQTQAP